MNMMDRNFAAMRSIQDGPAPQQEQVMPCNMDAERGLLGAAFVNNEAYQVALQTGLEARHFSEPFHRLVFDAIGAAIKAGKKNVNPVTIRSHISPDDLAQSIDEMTTAQYCARLASDAVSIIHAEDFARAIIFFAARREGIHASQVGENACYDADDEVSFVDQITQARDRYTNLLQVLEGRSAQDDEEVIEDYLQMITGEHDEVGADGIPLPFSDFEYLINDNMLRPGRTYGMLGASAEGKTSLTLHVVHAAVMAGHPVCYFSFDQDQREILAQMAAQNVGIPFNAQIQNSRNRQRLSEQQIDKGYGYVRRLKRGAFEVINCNTTDTVPKLQGKMRGFMRRRANGKTPLFIYDHIRAIRSSIQGDEGSKALQIGQDIKSAVKEERAAGWILQQRSSSGLKRENPRPTSSDLYGGDAAKQPFDVIFYVYRASEHRDEQMKTAKDDAESNKISNRFQRAYGADFEIDGNIELGMVKNRFGNKNRRAILGFEAEYTRFSSHRNQTPELFS